MNNENNTILADCKAYSLSIKNIDDFRCFIANLTGFAFNYDFGYYNLGLLFLIIFLSIFGGIKGIYRWLLLNQALFDVLISYSYSCGNGPLAFVKQSPTCIYVLSPGLNYVALFNIFIEAIVDLNPFSGLFLLTVSRFLALYSPNLYAKFTKRLFLSIFLLNLFIFFLCSKQIFLGLSDIRRNEIIAEYRNQKLSNTICLNKGLTDNLVLILSSMYYPIKYISMFVPALLLLFSVLSASLIVLRLLKQAKFQLKHNPKDFQNSLRICVVVVVQNLLNLFVFLTVSVDQVKYILSYIFRFKVLTAISPTWTPSGGNETVVDFRLPLWIDGVWRVAAKEPKQFFNQFRIFFDSIIVLFVMTGYREAMVKLLKHAYFSLRHPKKFWNKIRPSTKTAVVNLVKRS